nr:carbohydrate-binding protein [Microscilla sp. PRE1]
MKTHLTLLITWIAFLGAKAQDWSGIPVPASAGQGKTWQLQSAASDDFNYTFNETSQLTNFGSNKWYNFYHNGWDGPGTTYWQYNHVSVSGGNLVLRASRNPSTTKMGVPGVNAGCITSNNRVKYPVFVEASVSVANIALASDVWLLSPDDTQEIDIIECYGGAGSNNAYFAQFIHLSHHSFVRNPFQDYQPRDLNSWWGKSGVSSWGDYCWNNGNRKYVRVGVNWVGPKHFEYYIDGELVRVLYDKAFATKVNGTWYYTYPTMTNGSLDFSGGYQSVVQYATGSSYSFSTLQAASNTSSTSVIDPYNYQGGNGFTKELDIIINVESQNWHVEAGRTPSDADLNDPAKNKMKVDWIRVYKPVTTGTGGGGSASITVEAESFASTGGTYNDASSGGPGYGVKKSGTIINYVNGCDWVEYPIVIPEEGVYEVGYHYATPISNTSVQFSVSGTPFFTTTLDNTGGWGNYQTRMASQTANFTAGNHLLKLTAGSADWQWNMDKVTLTRVGNMNSRYLIVPTSDVEGVDIKVFPNPTTDDLRIQGLDDKMYQVYLYDLGGTNVYSRQVKGAEARLDVSQLSDGIYLLKLEGESLQQQMKLHIRK